MECAVVGRAAQLPYVPWLSAQSAIRSLQTAFSSCPCLSDTSTAVQTESRYSKLKAPTSNPHSFLQVRFNSQSYSFLQPFYFYFSPEAFSALLSNVPKKNNLSFIFLYATRFHSSQPLGHTNHCTSIYIPTVRNSGTSNTLVFSTESLRSTKTGPLYISKKMFITDQTLLYKFTIEYIILNNNL